MPPRWFVVFVGAGLALIVCVATVGAVDLWIRNRRWRRPEVSR